MRVYNKIQAFSNLCPVKNNSNSLSSQIHNEMFAEVMLFYFYLILFTFFNLLYKFIQFINNKENYIEIIQIAIIISIYCSHE